MNSIGRRVAAVALVAAFGFAASAQADPSHPHFGGDRGGDRGGGGGTVRYAPPAGRGYTYPSRGAIVGALPGGGVSIQHHDHRYWYHGGSWYAPRGPRWIVVTPPFGAYVPFLPGFYSTFWWSGMPYFYANDAYYVWREPRREYEVVEPPAGAPDAAPAAEDIYMYPRNGQTQEQQSQDRYECHRWSADQTHFDPTRIGGGVADGDAPVRRAEYFRAMGACLEGRGYSVK